MSHPYGRMGGLLFLLFLLVVDGNEQLLAGVYAKLGVDVAHVIVESLCLDEAAKQRLLLTALRALRPRGRLRLGEELAKRIFELPGVLHCA